MMAKTSLVLVLLLVALVGQPPASDAVPITVTIAGQSPLTGNDSVQIAGTTWTPYGNIQIRARNGVGTARVIAGDGSAGGRDNVEDELKLINAEIKRANIGVPTDNTEYLITFQGTFDNPPQTPNGNYSYELSGMGDIRTTVGNFARAKGFVGATQVADLLHTVVNINYAFFSNIGWLNIPPPNIAGQRILKCDFSFKLQKTTDILKVGAGAGIMLQDAPTHEQTSPDTTRMNPDVLRDLIDERIERALERLGLIKPRVPRK